MLERKDIARHFLSAGLVVVFGYFGIDKFIHPLLWIGWIPPWMDGLLGFHTAAWLSLIGVLEILTAIFIAVPMRKVNRIGATLAALQLLGILTQVGVNDIGVRDFGLLLSAVALMIL